MALVDRGDSRAVTYLGSCMLTTTATGVGAIQKPLRELYFSFRQAGGAPDPSKQRYLTMSSRGLTMSWREAAKAAPTEVFYSMPNTLFWDAVQFVVVKGTKKLCGAFEPLDNDHSRNKDNLFVVLEKKYHFLQQMKHPSLFVCVLRRTTGVKAMDVHIFVCSSDDEALGLIHGLNTIQNSYNDNQVSETGAFSYKPFQAGGEIGSGPSSGGGPAVPRPVPGLGHQPTGPASANIQHLAAQNAVAAAAAIRQSQAYSRQPTGQIDHKSYESDSSQANSVISLTQNDFQPIARGSPEREPLRPRRPAFPEPDISRIEEEEEDYNYNENVYQYIGHIDDSDFPAVAPTRGGVDSRGFAAPNSMGIPAVTSPYDRNRNRIPNEDIAREARPPPKEYQSMTKSIEFDQDTFSATALRPSNIIRRFEEKSKATAAVRPHSIVAPKVAPKTAPKPTPSPVERTPSKLGQGYSFLSGSGSPGQADRRYEYDNAPSPHPRARSPGYNRELPEDSSLPRPHLIPSAFYAHQHDRHEYEENPRDQPPHLPDRAVPIAADAWRPPPRNDQNLQPPRYQNQARQDPPRSEQALLRQPSPFDRPASFGERNAPDPPPPRPVAKVTPHKVSGVGVRVLPTNPSALSRGPGDRPTSRVSPLDYHSQSNMPEEYNDGVQKQGGGGKDQYGDQKGPADNSGSQERRGYDPKWKQNPSEKDNPRKEVKKGEDADKNMSEKLLLSKKKDAEIASVMQHLRFDYDTSTVTPGVPAGNNFEKSLGYFP